MGTPFRLKFFLFWRIDPIQASFFSATTCLCKAVKGFLGEQATTTGDRMQLATFHPVIDRQDG